MKRYWQTDLWSKLFDVLLNIPEDGPQPDLRALADEVQRHLDGSLSTRQKLRQLLVAQHALLRDAGLIMAGRR